jgi:hypothetical protein
MARNDFYAKSGSMILFNGKAKKLNKTMFLMYDLVTLACK